jgi:sigma-B regulation protein RsbU (phosphoserine phosphatase)
MSPTLASHYDMTQTTTDDKKTPAALTRAGNNDILIAEDDRTSRRMLESILVDWGFNVTAACDGEEAWHILQQPEAPRLAIIDWLMPKMDGLEVCRQARTLERTPPYLILLTVKTNREDIVTGLRAGADDYITKPFDLAELAARLQVGRRILDLQGNLTARIRELEQALSEVKQLQGLLPICMYCKKIRNDQNYWEQVEIYVSERSHASFTHGICPACMETVVQPHLDALGFPPPPKG